MLASPYRSNSLTYRRAAVVKAVNSCASKRFTVANAQSVLESPCASKSLIYCSAIVAKTAKSFLDLLVQLSNVVEGAEGGKKRGPLYPKLMDLLTDPEFYKDKKKGHPTKQLAERYQTEKAEREFQMEQEKEQARKDEEIDELFKQIPEGEKQMVADEKVYSAVL